MAYTEKRYIASGNDFIESSIGGIIGVEYQRDGDTYRDICVNFSVFDFANRTATNKFVSQVRKSSGAWAYDSSYDKSVTDFNVGVSIGLASFGDRVLEEDMYQLDGGGNRIPVDQPWKWQLKNNVTTEAQFFIDTIVKNKYGVIIDMAAFISMVVIRRYGLV